MCFSFLCLILGRTTRACWLHLEKVMKNWPNRWKLRRYRAALSIAESIRVCVCVCVLSCSVSVQCYWRAYSVGDVEKMALLKLAK